MHCQDKNKNQMEDLQMQDLEKIAREERNAYFREWRSKNKDKVKAINKRYWENRAKNNTKKKQEDNKNDR